MSRRVAATRRGVAAFLGHIQLSAVASGPVIAFVTAASTVNTVYLRPDVYAEQFLLRVTMVVLAGLAFFLPLRLWWRAVARSAARAPSPLLIVGVLVALSTMRSVALSYALAATGYDSAAIGRMAFSALWFAAWVIFSAVFVDAMRGEVDRANRIEALTEGIAATRRECRDALRTERAQVTGEVAAAVLPCVDSISGQSGVEIVERLRAVAHGVVRPISHQLAAQTPTIELPPVRISDYRVDVDKLTTEATRSGRLPIVGMTAVAFVLPVVYYFALPSGGIAVLPAALAAAVFLPAGLVLNRVLAPAISRFAPTARAWLMTGELLGLGGVYFAWGQLTSVNDDRVVQSLMSALILAPAVGWLLLMLGATSRLHQESAAKVEALTDRLRWEVARANAQLRAQRRQMARQLHGPLQAALNAGAVRIDRANSQSIDPELALMVRKSILDAMTELVFERFLPRDVHVALERVLGTWYGLCDITLVDPDDVLGQLGEDPVCASAASDIITEGCSDSVRHGRATHVHIRLTRSDDVVRIEVVDDGTGIIEGWQAGLGSALLDAVTVSWCRENSPHGTELIAEVPFGPMPVVEADSDSGGLQFAVPREAPSSSPEPSTSAGRDQQQASLR